MQDVELPKNSPRIFSETRFFQIPILKRNYIKELFASICNGLLKYGKCFEFLPTQRVDIAFGLRFMFGNLSWKNW